MTPKPRLKHVNPGQSVTLLGERKPRILVAKSGHYGFFDGAMVALCHPVNPDNMTFGDGIGWHVKEEV